MATATNRRRLLVALALIAIAGIAFAITVAISALVVAEPEPPIARAESDCDSVDPNDPVDDPNADFDGVRGRLAVSTSPVPDGFPTPATTGLCGVGITIAELDRSGPMTITEDGAVVDGRDVVGTIKVKANDVTIRNSRVSSTGVYAVQLFDGFEGLVIEDSRIRGVGDGTSAAVYLQGYGELRRVHVSGGRDNLKAARGALVEDSYLTGLYHVPGAHNDTVQVRSGTNYTLRHNTMIGPWQRGTAVVLFQAKSGAGGGPIADVVIEGNYFSGGGYTIRGDAADFGLTGGIVQANRVELGSWNYDWFLNGAEMVDRDNVQLPS